MSTTTKPVNQKAWFLILPVLHVRGLLGHPAADDGGELFGAGHHLARAPRVCGHRVVRRCHARRGAARALLRQITFSLAVLAVEIPLGILLALSMPAQGWKSSACWWWWRCRC
jgi:glycerol transport system permease protein